MEASKNIPNLEALISGLNTSKEESQKEAIPDRNDKDADKRDSVSLPSNDDFTLWNALMISLRESRRDKDAPVKMYMIDSDLVETIAQCNFGYSTTRVINNIVRLFLMANMTHLKEIRKTEKVETLFDKNI